MDPLDPISDANPRSEAVQPDAGAGILAGEAGAATPAGMEGARRRGKRRKAKRGRRAPRPVAPHAPAEPDARAAAAAEALAERGEGIGTDPATGEDAAAELVAPPLDLAALAAEAEPVFRLAFKGLGLALRSKSPKAAAAFYASAGPRAAALTSTVGLRLAERLGGKLSALALVAELVEPFADDRWSSGPAKAEPSGASDAK